MLPFPTRAAAGGIAEINEFATLPGLEAVTPASAPIIKANRAEFKRPAAITVQTSDSDITTGGGRSGLRCRTPLEKTAVPTSSGQRRKVREEDMRPAPVLVTQESLCQRPGKRRAVEVAEQEGMWDAVTVSSDTTVEEKPLQTIEELLAIGMSLSLNTDAMRKMSTIDAARAIHLIMSTRKGLMWRCGPISTRDYMLICAVSAAPSRPSPK